ncbi:MAG TPA: LuxR family transcriptional regulator [Salinarimonas sp.]|nr:LuxR family transcriptional regulator [Salinarimonas sp.]
MSSIRQATFEIVDRLSRQTATDAVIEELRAAGAVFGYENFCISGLPLPRERVDPYVLASGWPEEWAERYKACGYVHADPVIRKVRVASMPFAWDEAPFDRTEDPAAARVMDEAPAFGLTEGFAVPIHTTHGFQAIVTFGGPRLRLDREERAALHLVAIYAHGQARAALHPREGAPEPSPILSPREMECLRWTAAGKTAWEISVILTLSERTVEQYVASAARKLNAVNRVQAVAEALRRQIIV